MKSTYLMAAITGLIIIAYSFTLSTSQVYQDRCSMMPSSPYSSVYTFLPALLMIAGVALILAPVAISVKVGQRNIPEEKLLNRPQVQVNHESDRKLEKLSVVEKLLEEDEKRVMKIIADNEGVTQDSIHFKTGFSASKVSLIIKKLEEKDLIYRERFGRTFRIYLSEWIKR